MRLAITGGSGLVGRAILRAAAASGYAVTLLGRRPFAVAPVGTAFQPWALGQPATLDGFDALVHAGFHHTPGRYRGGEGDDPYGFARLNRDGSLRLFADAAGAGVSACLFLSSRAVFDGYPPGTRLAEDLPPRPTTLYGQVKAEAEAALAALATPRFRTASLRATGVYAWPEADLPGKWQPLFDRFLAGEAIAPGIATEVHADDLARAALLILGTLLDEAKGLAAEPGQAGEPLPAPHGGPPDGPSTAAQGAPQATRATAPPSPQPAGIALPASANSAGTAARSPARDRRAAPTQAQGQKPGDCGSSNLDISSTNPASEGRHPPTAAAPPTPPDQPTGEAPSPSGTVFHISDLILDRRVLLARYALQAPPSDAPALHLPAPSDPAGLKILDCSRLLALGWRGGGMTLLDATLAAIAAGTSGRPGP